MASVDRIKRQTGRFFHSVTLEVHPGILLAQELETYHYSIRSFSRNGRSEHSKGISQSTPDSKAAKIFFDESNTGAHEDYPIIAGSPHSCVTEAFSQAKVRQLHGSHTLHTQQTRRTASSELMANPKFKQDFLRGRSYRPLTPVL